ncbi:hypothetical protein [Serratia quinivorans]|uniref:hypothetical protein n=1 Tax=Serratia quinivorans TaxID=137545 RepID=UPI002179C63E|nr:hypothetical protein [Serratia quinivorans]CAI2035434.1 Uncharacterised protein [Serratia quinivorans]
MSDIEEMKNNTITVFKERVSGPFGYILISFIAYNWTWFYFLIFSNKLAEVKISSVISGFQKLPGFGWPVFYGLLLAICTPFIKALMLHITAWARQIEDRKTHEIKNYLDNYIESTNLELADKRLDITEKNSKIHNLIEQRTFLDSEIRKYHKTLEELRTENAMLMENINNSKREKHNIENIISEYRMNNENFETLRQKLHNKSHDFINLKRNLIALKSGIEKISAIIHSDPSFIAMLDQNERYNFEKSLHQLQERIDTLDESTFHIVSFTFNDTGNEVAITTILDGVRWEDFISLLKSESIPAAGFIFNIDGTVSIRFERALTNEEIRIVGTLYRFFSNNH